MKKLAPWAVLAAVLSLCLVIASALAQAPAGAGSGQPMSGPRIAVIDISKIFKNDARFKAWMEQMKADVQRAETLVGEERKRIQSLEESLRDMQKGTQAYKDMEEQITAKKADLSVKVQIQTKQFQQQQAKIYYNVYQEIQQATDYFCKQHGIDVVLQVKGDAVDSEQAEQVIPYINKQVVWHAADLDITTEILNDLNRTAIPRAADGRGAPGQPTSPFGGGQQQPNSLQPNSLPPR